MVKNLPAKAGETKKHTFDPWVGKIPLEEGMATHSSILAWRIPWTEEPGGLQSIEPHRVRHDWSDLACTHANVLGVSLVDQKAGDLGSIPRLGRSPEEGSGIPTPVFLPKKSHRQKSVAGYSPWGHKESDMTEWLSLHLQGTNPKLIDFLTVITFCSPKSHDFIDCSFIKQADKGFLN